jgi:hypothetical protein
VSRRTFAEVREAAKAERDIEFAAFLDGYAALVRTRRADPCAAALATSIEGLASSVRAGLVDEGLPSGLALVPARSGTDPGSLNGGDA